jgi:hypothetical protein
MRTAVFCSRIEKKMIAATNGAPRIRPWVSTCQSSVPSVARSARSLPSNPPTKIRPSATAGVVYP